MAFGKNFIVQPDCVKRVPWFVPLDRREMPEGIAAELLADLFDLACKFGFVMADGHARSLEAEIGSQTVVIVAAMPKGDRGPRLSVTLPPLASGVSEVEEFATQGADGVQGLAIWDVRLSVADMRALIREADALMAGYGCIDATNGERYGIFDPAIVHSIALPVDDYFRERGAVLRLPDNVRCEVVINRFKPKGSLVMLHIDQAPHLCRTQDVPYLKERAKIRNRVSEAVYRKYGLRYGVDDETGGPDDTTMFRMQAEIDERVQRAITRSERRRSKRGG